MPLTRVDLCLYRALAKSQPILRDLIDHIDHLEAKVARLEQDRERVAYDRDILRDHIAILQPSPAS